MSSKVSLKGLAESSEFLLANQAIIEFSDIRDVSCNDVAKISYKGNKNGYSIRLWGRDNSLPQFREQVVAENNIVPTLLQTKRDITFGTGLFAYKNLEVSDEGKINIEEVPMPEMAEAFFDAVDIDDYLLEAAKSLFLHSNIFTEAIRSNKGDITWIGHQDCKYVRLGEQNRKGKIEKAFISGAWATTPYAKEGVTEFDREVFPLPLYDSKLKQPHFILHTGDRFFNDGYYNSPGWWGSLGWIQLANAIPIFHQANIDNGYTIRFHIKVPKDYFYTSPASDSIEALKSAREEEVRKKAEFMEMVNGVLAGKKNAGRALFTQFDLTAALGSQFPGITIEPINVDIKDKALLELFEKSNTANISSQGIHPTLANIETQGRLSSGSEIRNAFIMYLAIKTPIPRRILLKVIDLVKRENGWPQDIFYAFGDTEITTLDESPTGIKEDAAVIPEKAA